MTKISQADIARELGISIATVSRSLRNVKGINPRTRARVLEKAVQKGYRGDRLQETPQSGNLNIGALLFCRELEKAYSDNVRSRVLRGMMEEAKRRDVAIHLDYITLPVSEWLKTPKAQSVGFRRGKWQGFILCGHLQAAELQAFLPNRVCVQVADHLPGIPVDNVDHDDLASCEALVDHLYGLGHRRIGFLDLGGQPIPCSYTRYAGYVTALARRGMPLVPENILGVTTPVTDKETAFAHVRDRICEGVRAWICTNDACGYQLLSALAQTGLQCPRDVSVCGFDNFEPPASLPKLTSIDAPFEAMGVMAVNRLLTRLRFHDWETSHMLLRCRLVLGESTGNFSG